MTFVGSFVDKNSDEKINDIDLIVITNRLNKKTFYKYIKEVDFHIFLLIEKPLGKHNLNQINFYTG